MKVLFLLMIFVVSCQTVDDTVKSTNMEDLHSIQFYYSDTLNKVLPISDELLLEDLKKDSYFNDFKKLLTLIQNAEFVQAPAEEIEKYDWQYPRHGTYSITFGDYHQKDKSFIVFYLVPNRQYIKILEVYDQSNGNVSSGDRFIKVIDNSLILKQLDVLIKNNWDYGIRRIERKHENTNN